MKEKDKLEMLKSQQFECLLHIVEDGIRDGTIYKNHPLWTLYLEKSSRYERILDKLLK